MAKTVIESTYGVDVAKDELVIVAAERGERISLVNQPAAIKAWLRAQAGPLRLALEPTSHYHLALIEQAQAAGAVVYLINPRQLRHYREAVGERNKTDAADAALLARYLQHEGQALTPFQPRSAKAQRLWALIKRRGTAVRAQQQLQQSLREVQLSATAVFTALRQLIARLDRHIQTLIQTLGWQADYRFCLTIPGIGPANAAALTAAFHRGAFARSDAFIAFVGMDIRLRESGQFKGQAKLSKYGEAEVRRLLYCATQAARSYRPFDTYYQAQLAKGRSKTAAKVALMRKLARIAFALMSQQQTFQKNPVTA